MFWYYSPMNNSFHSSLERACTVPILHFSLRSSFKKKRNVEVRTVEKNTKEQYRS